MVRSVFHLSIGYSLILAVASCAPDAEAPSEQPQAVNASQTTVPKRDDSQARASSRPRLEQREFERFLKQAKSGDVAAMHTLSIHHLSKGEISKAYDWLRNAAKLGDCEAVIHLVDDDFDGVTRDEAQHWQKEQMRLGCDPQKDYGTRPTIRRHPEEKGQ